MKLDPHRRKVLLQTVLSIGQPRQYIRMLIIRILKIRMAASTRTFSRMGVVKRQGRESQSIHAEQVNDG
ncbi:MAG: hypothetical protein NZ899_01610 [Thermoguttaceae bacterium]|nr:hypothetical protein [Thermoguttaceae bacterium]MDW8078631.1 hypothetical protein [Thermoguttaceae bacterium]